METDLIILVTGATGFIGEHLIQKLLKQKVKKIYYLSRNKLGKQNENLIFIKADLCKRNWLESIPKEINVIIHLAQSNKYNKFPEEMQDMVDINLNSTSLLLEWGRKNNIKYFLFASTGNVYKRSKKLVTEKELLAPDSFYSATKAGAEFIARHYKKYFRIDILRFFTVYGPSNNKKLINLLIDKVKNNENIELASNIGIELTPIYISDCINIILKLIFKKVNKSLNIFNIAGDEKTNLFEIIQLISEELNIKPIIKTTKVSPKCLCGNNKQISKFAKYELHNDMKSGLKKTIENRK